MENKDSLLVYSLAYPNAKQYHQQYYYKDSSLEISCLMHVSESEEGPSAHKLLTHLGRLTQVWVYIGKHPKQ